MNVAENLTQPVAAQALSNRRDWAFHAQRINTAWGRQIESIIETGKYLIEARDELEDQSFRSMIQMKLSFEKSTAYGLIKIAEHPIIRSVQHVGQLPPSWGTLLELTKLPAAMLREKLSDGSINPKLQRKEVSRWRKAERGEDGEVKVDGKTIQRKPSLAEQLKSAKTEIEMLKTKLARKDDGSLFDLKHDSVASIAEVIAANISESRAADLAKAIPEAVKELKRKRQKPAG